MDFVRQYIDRYIRDLEDDKGAREYLITSYLGRACPLYVSVEHDIVTGNSYNIVPSHVRKPEDIAQAPSINSDGSGLAATLYRLQTSSGHRLTGMYGPRGRYYPREAFKKVKEFFLLVNPNISDIGIKNDPYENKLKLFALVKKDNSRVTSSLLFF
jgi:hypothetical protein